MKKFLLRLFDIFLGVNFTIGFVTAIWAILSVFLPVPKIDVKNMQFLAILCFIPWLTNYIFDYASNLYVKGTLHAVVWFVLGVIVYNLMYSSAPEPDELILIGVIFAVSYALVLNFFYYLSSKANMPVRRFAEFYSKLLAQFFQ